MRTWTYDTEKVNLGDTLYCLRLSRSWAEDLGLVLKPLDTEPIVYERVGYLKAKTKRLDCYKIENEEEAEVTIV